MALGLGAALFALYAAGSSRTIYVGDSGELVTAVHLLGIPHPSGYPLYVLLGKLWTLIVPVGSIAFRMSLFSAACAAGACAMLYVLGRAMRLARSAALVGALLLAFSPSFWLQSTIQRVYTLNALFLALAAWAAWHWHDRLRDRRLVLAFFLCGLGASNHLFMGPVAVCLGVFAVLRHPPLLSRIRLILLCGAAFGIGLLPYVYLPLRSRMDPRLDWGNPETLSGFMAVVFRGDFWERAWIEGPLDLFPIAGDYLGGLVVEMAWSGAFLLLAGLLAWRKLGAFLVLPVMVMGANLASMALHGSRVDIFIWHRYYIPSYLMAALLAAAGWDLIACRLQGRWGSRTGSKSGMGLQVLGGAVDELSSDPAPDRMMDSVGIRGGGSDGHHEESTAEQPATDLHDHGGAWPQRETHPLEDDEKGGFSLTRQVPLQRVIPWLALALPAWLLVTGWERFDRSRYRISEAFSRSVLESLPPGAHLIATDDNILFTSMYLHLVEGVRPDVNLILQGVGGAQLPPLKFNPDEDPVYFTHHPNWNQPGLEIVPVGLTFRAWRAGRPWPELSPLPDVLEGEDDPRVPKDHLTQNLIGQFHYMKGVTLAERDWPGAEAEFRKAAEAAPDNDVLFYNLGLIYRRNGLVPEALEWFRRSHTINPRHLASHDRPRASDKVAELEKEAERLAQVEKSLGSDPTLAGLAQGSPEWHLAMAALLESRGHSSWARGHELSAPRSAPGSR